MAENSKIAWTHATFNPWWGCVKVSPGCDNCYAERDAHRFMPELELWGGKLRREFSDHHWKEPRRWAERAAREHRRLRVFCASMADVLDKDAPPGARERLWDLIETTPTLDWLLLTKRIGNAKTMLPAYWLEHGCPPNVWFGISVVNQEEADRDIPKLLTVPASIRWLSIEPMLGPVDLSMHLGLAEDHDDLRGQLHWIIVGGESGPRARRMENYWALNVMRDCKRASVPYFFKQGSQVDGPGFKDINTYPPHMRKREFPVALAPRDT